MTFTTLLKPALASAVLLALETSQLFGADNFQRTRNQMFSQAGRKPSSANKPVNKDESYILQKLSVPAPYFAGMAIDINNRQTVSGMFYSPVGEDITFTWSKGQEPKLIRHPEAPITAVASISDTGELFGNWGSFTEQTAGFHHPQSNTWKPLPPYPGKNLNIGQRANNSGRATGYACNGTWSQPENCVTWVWNGKAYEIPVLPPSPFVILDGINEVGKMTGRYLVAPPFDFRAFVLDGENTTILLPGTKSAAYDLNNREEVVLNFEVDPLGPFEPAVFRDGKLNFLPLFPGALGTTYIGLNDKGDFAGLAYDTIASFTPYPIVAIRQ